MTVVIPGYKSAVTGGPPVTKLADAAHSAWVRRLVDTINGILAGKLNVVTQITLNAGAATTTVIDARIGPFSALLLQPLTSNAQADYVSATGVIATSQQAGQATFTHPNNANADKTFNLVIIG